jgi:hypothetical protein
MSLPFNVHMKCIVPVVQDSVIQQPDMYQRGFSVDVLQKLVFLIQYRIILLVLFSNFVAPKMMDNLQLGIQNFFQI